MKLDGLRIFHEQLERELSADSIVAHVYYFHGSKWHNLSTETACSDAETRELTKSRAELIAHHVPKSQDAWFYLDSVDAAVRLVFPQSPKSATRQRKRHRILEIQESASNAFKVSHNPLTQLLARDALRERLATEISKIDMPPEISGAEAPEIGISRSLVVMALDIDHFKQVNDTWGHLYGDQVLKAFGRRLEQCAARIRQNGVGNPHIYLGHPSGEEFLIVIQASVLRDQFFDWADEFRKAIADDVMPSESEWQWLSESGGTGSLSPPPLQERATTASIGLAIHNNALRPHSSVDVISDLLDRADTALYRAKAAGRNQVIAFDEILSSCGRVLEQDANTRVVALDIGSNVGVDVGQEFKVFLPTFTGRMPFLLNDGRTKRTLGHYPRVESARVVVFNVQPEISFAFIAAPTEPLPTLDSGSHLEAIPAGSIGHLLPSFSKYFPSTPNSSDQGGLENLQAFVKESAENGSPFAIVIRFTRDAEYLRKYGLVALNMALAQLFREAQFSFHAAKAVEVLDKGSICIAGAKANYKETLVEEFVDRIASELPELGVVAGVFCDADREKSVAEGQSKLDAVNAVEFARFAASDAGRLPDKRVRHFNYPVAISVLSALRESRSFKVAYADFERLRKLGVESAGLFNLGGLIASNIGLFQQAFEHYAAAMTKSPESLIYKGNYGMAAERIGEIDSALKVLNLLPLGDIDTLRKIHPYGYFAYARLLARAKLSDSALYNPTRFARVAQEALAIPEFSASPYLDVIRKAQNTNGD